MRACPVFACLQICRVHAEQAAMLTARRFACVQVKGTVGSLVRFDVVASDGFT